MVLANINKVAQALDVHFRRWVKALTGALLCLMVSFICYTVIMRYFFNNPPFWGDTVALFCNIWIVLLALYVSVRERKEIAVQTVVQMLPAKMGFAIDIFWRFVILCFGVFMVWYGTKLIFSPVIAMAEYWELGGLSKTYPMLVVPISGVLIAIAACFALIEDIVEIQSMTQDQTSEPK